METRKLAVHPQQKGRKSLHSEPVVRRVHLLQGNECQHCVRTQPQEVWRETCWYNNDEERYWHSTAQEKG
jgi:hypothetical protein